MIEHLKQQKVEKARIVGYEVSKELVGITKENTKESKYSISIREKDFLTCDSGSYHFIIGNPPYFDILKKDREKYVSLKQFLKGRVNIYGLFIVHSVKKLKKGGVMGLIVPNSLRSSPSLQSVREYLVSEGRIVSIEPLGQFSKEANQDVMLLAFVKGETDGKNYIRFKNGDIVFYEGSIKVERTIGDVAQVYNGSVSQDCQLRGVPRRNSFHHTLHALLPAEIFLDRISIMKTKDINHKHAVLGCNDQLLKSGWKTDVTIKVGEKSLLAHQLVLGLASPYFKSMLEANMKEVS